MGVQAAKPLDRKPSRSKSALSQKAVSSQEISEFASQLNHLVCINLENEADRYDYLVFKKIPFTGKFAPLPLCSRISTQYNSVFVCYDCSFDPHAYLCEQCFEKGNHQGHRFSVFPNNAGWNQLYCRCGDYEFMNKGKICQDHKEVKMMPTVFVDPKEKKKFSLYFQEIFKTLFSLMQKSRGAESLLTSFWNYLQKSTENNLLYSKILCEFLLQKNSIDGQSSNLYKLITKAQITNTNFFRNINFATEYKLPILRQIIMALNSQSRNVRSLNELIINFSGKMEHLEHLAKEEGLILGVNAEKEFKKNQFQSFYDKLIQNNFEAPEIWKCMLRKKLVANFIKHDNIIRKILEFLYEQKSKELNFAFLEQLLECKIEQSKSYIIPCLMIMSPECFIASKSSKEKGFDKKIEALFVNYYQKLFSALNTNNSNEQSYEKMIMLLPYFSFGEQAINSFWEEMERRVSLLEKSKEKAIIKGASQNYFSFLTKILRTFFSWEHLIIQEASKNKLKSFSQDKKLIDRLLKEYFFKQRKIPRLDLLSSIDTYTQKERNLATQPIKKYLRYNSRKGKYYYVADKLENNLFNYEELKIGANIKLSDWQEFVVGKLFTETLYQIVPKLIKAAQKGLMEDIEMVKTVSNISIALTLLNKPEKKILKEVTRNFIRQIPDVKQDVYYVLAAIRDRFELDMDDLEESGMKGHKKVKLDLITQIRDKKYREMKERQDKVLKEWLDKEDQADLHEQDSKVEQNFCHICKQKQQQKNRFVYLCNFTRNNVISTLLKSQVTDLDMNICLHKVHEQCFEKVQQKRKCPVCKFDVNCYIPARPLIDESFTKNWLRNFENIVTRINLESGKSFNSDWATIFMTYLVFSRSFKVLLKSSEIQTKQMQKIDSLLMLHYRNQLERWPELTKQAIKRAEKTVKGQVCRQSNIKKTVKSLSLDLVMQQIDQEPLKNQKRVQKKVRQMINFIGQKNSQKVAECFEYCRTNAAIKQILEQSISEESQENKELFKLKEFPQNAKKYLETASIKCPMCGKYQPSTWQCLFCDKVSCQNCISIRSHCQRDHRGSSIILCKNNAEYKLIHENREVENDSLYRNEYSQGWTRNLKPQGWKCCTDEIYIFFDAILHSLSINKNKFDDDNSDDGRGGHNGNFGFAQPTPTPVAFNFGFPQRTLTPAAFNWNGFVPPVNQDYEEEGEEEQEE